MFVKLQHLDTNCVPILHQVKNSKTHNNNGGVSIPLPPHRTQREFEQQFIKKHQIPPQKPPEFHKRTVFVKPKPNPVKEKIVVENHGGFKGRMWSRKKDLHTKCSTKVVSGNEVVKNMHTRCLMKVVSGNEVVEKVHTKCSMKWARYVGCIPAILEALERIDDLDEAFKPWEFSLSNKERTIILKEQKDWQRVMEIFNWVKRKGCYELNVIHYNIMIRVLGKARKWDELEMLRDEMEKNGIESINSTLGTLIDVYSKGGIREKAMYWLDVMNEKGMEPGETHNTLIDTYGKAERVNDASETFEQMLKEAKGYFKKMQEASLEPDAVSYRTLLYAFSIRHMVCEAEELVNDMDKRDLEIDEFTQSSLTRMYIDAGMLEQSWLWFNRFHIQGKMSPECYSASIDAFGERGYILEAEKVFKCCQERRNPTVLEFNVMIKAYGLNKKYDNACRLIDSPNEHGVFPDKCSYNSLIQMLASADLTEKAIFYLRKMQESRLVSDCIPYSAVISSLVKLGQLEKAVGLFEEMIEFNIKPDVVVYGVLINAYADVGDVEEALHYVNEMKGTGLGMNGIICNSLIKLYTKVGCLKDAEEAYYTPQKLDAGTDVYSSNCMIDLYTERSMVKPAEEIFEKLRRNGTANEFSYAMMLCMYKKIGSFDEAFEMAKQMRESGLLTDLLSYNHVLGLYASDGRFKEALTIFKEMIESGVQPNDSTFKSLGVLMKRGVAKKAVKNLEIMWRDDDQSGLKAWLETLNSVVGMVYYDISD
ncbi:hypothetical protein L1987_32547 [Smallanthus sonchifolius]|uniref:Uncharacterized protein n=1 Tax=Smallanthus sonchifolius TaxID=185202 RepID=A0ACB9HPW3_9ASTR|nr:hypothetical protein L1987_32547 [Smallanthus sonchifolius]